MWNLKADIEFHLSRSALLLFCPVLLLILSFFLLLAESPAYFPEISVNLFVSDLCVCVFSVAFGFRSRLVVFLAARG